MLLHSSGDFLKPTHHFLKAGPGIVAKFRNTSRYFLRQEAEVLHGLKHGALHQVMVREARFGTTKAWVIGPGFGAGPVPKDTITTCSRHWPSATNFVKEATAAFAEVAIDFLGKAYGVGATRLDEIRKEGLGAMVIINEYIADSAGTNGNENLGYPVRMRRAARYVDHGQAAF